MDDFLIVVISVILSTLTSIGVAWFFRFRTKPKHEIIYDSNRQENLTRIFYGLKFFDMFFERVYSQFNNEFGILNKEKESLIYKSQDISDIDSNNNFEKLVNFGNLSERQLKLDKIRDYCEREFQNMKERFQVFINDYNIYQNYFHDSFLRDIREYYDSTVHYTEWLLKGENYHSIGIKTT